MKLKLISIIPIIVPTASIVSCSEALDDKLQKMWDITMSDVYSWQDFKSVASYDNDELIVKYVKSELMERGREYIFDGPTKIDINKFYKSPTRGEVIEYWIGAEISHQKLLNNYSDQVENFENIVSLFDRYLEGISLKNNIIVDLESIVFDLNDDEKTTIEKLENINNIITPYVLGYVTIDHNSIYNALNQIPWSASIWAINNDHLFNNIADINDNIFAIFDIITNLSLPALMESSKLLEAYVSYTN